MRNWQISIQQVPLPKTLDVDTVDVTVSTPDELNFYGYAVDNDRGYVNFVFVKPDTSDLEREEAYGAMVVMQKATQCADDLGITIDQLDLDKFYAWLEHGSKPQYKVDEDNIVRIMRGETNE